MKGEGHELNSSFCRYLKVNCNEFQMTIKFWAQGNLEYSSKLLSLFKLILKF